MNKQKNILLIIRNILVAGAIQIHSCYLEMSHRGHIAIATLDIMRFAHLRTTYRAIAS